VSTYKVQALDNMQKTVDVLTLEVDKSRSYLDRVRGEQVKAVTDTLAQASEGEIRL
jgi:hypothetical protein